MYYEPPNPDCDVCGKPMVQYTTTDPKGFYPMNHYSCPCNRKKPLGLVKAIAVGAVPFVLVAGSFMSCYLTIGTGGL